MLLEPGSWSLAQASDGAIASLSDDLSHHVAPETHAAVVELTTGVHTGVEGVGAELAGLRSRLTSELRPMGLAAAAAGTHPLAVREETQISGAARYRLLGDALRGLARREPTMALHVHVGVPEPEDAIRLANGLRRSVPVLIALSANSPFWQGRDDGFDSTRTMIFHAFPRTGQARSFANYEDYVEALDAVIAPGAVPDPSFFWWDVRPQPALGTVEVRVMDAQSTVAEVTPLVAFVQSLARLELEDAAPLPATPGAEVLAENRFLAARDGMDAHLIEPGASTMVPVRQTLDTLLARCRPHALALGCATQLERVRSLSASNGAGHQRAFSSAEGGLDRLIPSLADRFVRPGWQALAGWT